MVCVDIIYDMKALIFIWLYISAFQYHGYPHIYFAKYWKGEMEMVYHLLAGDEQKEWLPKEKRTSSWKMHLLGTQLYSNQKMQKMWHLMLWREQWNTSVHIWLELTPIIGGVHLLPVKGKRE